MAFLDEIYANASPEEAPRFAQLPESDFLGRGSAIAEHQAGLRDFATKARYLPELRNDQNAQNYLGPLAAQDFARDSRRSDDAGGIVASAGSPLYAGLKAISPAAASWAFGTGQALPSEASIDQVARAYKGLGQAVPREGIGSNWFAKLSSRMPWQ